MTGAQIFSYKNALAVVLLTRGIPIIYYGTEQAFSGGDVGIRPEYRGYTGQREVMWPHYDTSAPLYSYISRLVSARKIFGIAGLALDQKERWSDTMLYAFSRGATLVAVTNVLSASAVLPLSSNPFPANTRACNFMADRVLNPYPCVDSKSDGSFNLTLTNGNFALYVPARVLNVQLNLSSPVYGAPLFHFFLLVFVLVMLFENQMLPR
jgi:alpha-amylase